MDILRLSALGGLLGLDATGVGQFMVSRPLVAGVLAGLVLGEPALGATVGVLLELYLLVSFPTGGARFPEGSTATVVAVACATPFEAAGALPLAVAVGLVWGQIAGGTVTLVRRVNARLVPEPGSGRTVGAARLTFGHLAAVALDFARGALVTLVGTFLGRLVVRPFAVTWPLGYDASTGLLLVGGAVSAGILLRDLGGLRRRGVWLAAGLTAGLVGTRLL